MNLEEQSKSGSSETWVQMRVGPSLLSQNLFLGSDFLSPRHSTKLLVLFCVNVWDWTNSLFPGRGVKNQWCSVSFLFCCGKVPDQQTVLHRVQLSTGVYAGHESPRSR